MRAHGRSVVASIAVAPFAVKPTLALVANADFANGEVEAPDPALRFSSQRELDQWFVREILPLESMLMRFLRRNWRDGAEIPDLRQEAYIRVYEAARRARPIQAKGFLFLILRNLMIDRLRQKKVVSIETMTDFEWLGVSDKAPTPEEHVAARQELRLLQVALDDLPPRCRQVVVLRKVDGCSQREVAKRMGITEETVEHQLAKGLRILADAIARVRPSRTTGKTRAGLEREASAKAAKGSGSRNAKPSITQPCDVHIDGGFNAGNVASFAPVLLQSRARKEKEEHRKIYSRTA